MWYYMLKSPEAYRKAQEEVDTVIGTRSIQYEDLSKLPYINAMLRETLRLQPTAPGFAVTPKVLRSVWVAALLVPSSYF